MHGLPPAMAQLAVFASAGTTVGLVLLGIIAALIALAGLVVLLPFHLRAAGGVDDLSLSGQVRVRWAWGLVAVRLSPERGATLHVLGLRCWTFRTGPDEKKEKKDKPKKPRARGWVQWMLRFRETAMTLLKRLIRTLRLQLRLQGELGLDDPTATALLNRLFLELDRMSESVSVQVEPDWMDERLNLDGEVTARIWLAHLGMVLLIALWSRETRQMIRTAPRAGR